MLFCFQMCERHGWSFKLNWENYALKSQIFQTKLISNHLIFIWRLQVVIKHLKMKHGRYMSTYRWHNPNPISWTTASQFVLIFVVLHERFWCRVMIENGHIRFLKWHYSQSRRTQIMSNNVEFYLISVQNCMIQFDKRFVFPQWRIVLYVKSHFLGYNLHFLINHYITIENLFIKWLESLLEVCCIGLYQQSLGLFKMLIQFQ